MTTTTTAPSIQKNVALRIFLGFVGLLLWSGGKVIYRMFTLSPGFRQVATQMIASSYPFDMDWRAVDEWRDAAKKQSKSLADDMMFDKMMRLEELNSYDVAVRRANTLNSAEVSQKLEREELGILNDIQDSLKLRKWREEDLLLSVAEQERATAGGVR
jgi:hypothetical protein